MWNYTYHCFDDAEAFVAACLESGFPIDELGQPSPPDGVAADIIGALPDDPRWHVNMAWYERDVPESFEASRVYPTTPRQVFATAASAS